MFKKKTHTILFFFFSGIIILVLLYGLYSQLHCFLMTMYDYPESPTVVSMEESKKLGVFLNEYKVIPNKFVLDGNEVVIYNAWTEIGWDKAGPCRKDLIRTPDRAPYHFNYEYSRNWRLNNNLFMKYALSVPIGNPILCATGVTNRGYISRHFVLSEVPDTVTAELRTGEIWPRTKTRCIQNVLFVKITP